MEPDFAIDTTVDLGATAAEPAATEGDAATEGETAPAVVQKKKDQDEGRSARHMRELRESRNEDRERIARLEGELRAFRQSQTPRSQGQSLKDQIAQRLKDKASRLSDTDARTADDYHNEQAAIIAEQMEGLESRVEARIRAQQESAPKQRSSGHVGLVAKFPWADEPENGAAVAAMAKKIMAAEDLDSNDDATVWRSAERACVIIAKQFGLSVPGGAAQGATTGAAGGALGGPSGGPTPAPTRLALDQANYWAKNLQTDPKIRAMPPAQLWPVFFRKVVAPQVGKK